MDKQQYVQYARIPYFRLELH